MAVIIFSIVIAAILTYFGIEWLIRKRREPKKPTQQYSNINPPKKSVALTILGFVSLPFGLFLLGFFLFELFPKKNEETAIGLFTIVPVGAVFVLAGIISLKKGMFPDK